MKNPKIARYKHFLFLVGSYRDSMSVIKSLNKTKILCGGHPQSRAK